jgi:3-hydroxyisobutyrate dehydrogenase-like beta-hydroxyacid dehydrogenase
MRRIGILHPGAMGVSVAASAIHSGHAVYWAAEGRSDQTRRRAREHHLIEVDSIAVLCQTCDTILSICPPHAAEEVAAAVLEAGFRGLYLDANAISPQRARRIAGMLEEEGVSFVDGGIIGGPAWKPQQTWLYVSGERAAEIADCFSRGPLEIMILGQEIGKASALKMCYAAYSKGTTALLAAILAAAQTLGVRDELYQEWDRDEAGFSGQVNRRVQRVTAKAWRFEGEMQEIAATLQAAGLPEGFHRAAAETYHRMTHFKDAGEVPALEDVLRALLP